MAIIKMNNGFAPIPEGNHIFRIYDVDFNENFGKVAIHLVTAEGRVHTERFTIMRTDGSMNDGACNALSYFTKIALNLSDNSVTEVDHRDLINRYIGAKVEHTVLPRRDNPDETITFVNLTEKWVADGFDTEPCEKALTIGTAPKAPEAPEPEAEPVGEVDLSSLLD